MVNYLLAVVNVQAQKVSVAVVENLLGRMSPVIRTKKKKKTFVFPSFVHAISTSERARRFHPDYAGSRYRVLCSIIESIIGSTLATR